MEKQKGQVLSEKQWESFVSDVTTLGEGAELENTIWKWVCRFTCQWFIMLENLGNLYICLFVYVLSGQDVVGYMCCVSFVYVYDCSLGISGACVCSFFLLRELRSISLIWPIIEFGPWACHNLQRDGSRWEGDEKKWQREREGDKRRGSRERERVEKKEVAYGREMRKCIVGRKGG